MRECRGEREEETGGESAGEGGFLVWGGGGGEFGDEVGEGDVGEVPGGEGQKEGDVNRKAR